MSRVKGGRPPVRPKGQCLDGCGACCDPVAMPFSQDDVRGLAPWVMDEANRRFVLDDLRPISREEGLRQSPYLGDGVSMAIVDGEMMKATTHFYRCRHFDTETRTCGNYDNRPPVCRDFPWYGDKPDPMKMLPPTCGYLPQVGRTPVPLPTRRPPTKGPTT